MTTDLELRLSEAVDSYQAEYVALLADLVRYPSTLGHERPAQERLLAHVRSMGLDAELWALDSQLLQRDSRYAPVERDYRGRPNLTAVWPSTGRGGRSLLFNGHIDVVNPEPVSWWKHDPWGGEIEDSRLYGRGALDMKGGLVQALLAIRAVQAVGVRPRGTVSFESVIEEECTGNGTLACRLRSGLVDAVVIPECVGMTATWANTGTLWARVSIRGKPAYVGRAGEYVNAIEKASWLIGRLAAIPDEINQKLAHPAYAPYERPFTLSVGTIEGGQWPSNVPLVCQFTCRLSFPPGVPVRSIQDLVERHIQVAAADDPWLASHPPEVDYPGFRAEGWAGDLKGPLVKTLAQCHQAMTGMELKPNVLFGTADARYFNAAAGEQVIYYGVSGGNMHAPDEYVDLSSVTMGAKTLAALIVAWCG